MSRVEGRGFHVDGEGTMSRVPFKIRIARGHQIFLDGHRGHRPKNSELGRGEIVNSTWTSQFVFKKPD